ncbi:MAG TPA: hypothetical protein VGE77_11740, partial [Nocardioides sp.]
NYPLTLWLRPAFAHEEVAGLLAAALTLVLAAASWRWVERPVAAWGRAREHRDGHATPVASVTAGAAS